MNEPILTVSILIFKNGKVLLVKHGEKAGHINGVYGIPGGHIEPGESEKNAAVREFFEETNISIKPLDLIDFPNNRYTADIERKNGKVKKYTMRVFLASKFEGKIKDNEETTPEWIDVNSLEKYNLLPNVASAINNAINHIN